MAIHYPESGHLQVSLECPLVPKADIHKIDSGQLPLPAELLVGAVLA